MGHLSAWERGSRSYTIRPTGEWGGRGPFIGRNVKFPPASEREARMDDAFKPSRTMAHAGAGICKLEQTRYDQELEDRMKR
jgi:hypothetical protein